MPTGKMGDKPANDIGIQRISITQCRRFSQNAWKKDLCSNCFKSKDEHKKPEAVTRPILDIIAPNSDLKPKQSILKSVNSRINGINSTNVSDSNGSLVTGKSCNDKTRGNSLKVNFPAEESQVIGFGGDDDFGSSDDSCEEDVDNNEVDNNECDETVHDEDENETQRITKLNTDFNSITANLLDQVAENSDSNKNGDTNKSSNDKKRLHIPLLLGRPNTGTDGQKQTLLVSVKPFGSDSEPNKLNKKQVVKNDTTVCNNKVNIVESKFTENVVQKENEKPTSERMNENICKIEKVDSIAAKPVNGLKETPTTNRENDTSIKNNETSDKKINGTALSEIRKTQITRGNVITKSHEQVKTKLFQTSGVVNDLKADSVILNDQVKEDVNRDANGEIKMVYLIVGNKHDVNNDELKDDVFTKNDYNTNSADVERKTFAASNLEIESSNKNSPVISNHNNVTRIQQKNYKNILSSDDNIKNVSFKDNISNIGCDFYGSNNKPSTNKMNDNTAIANESLMVLIDSETNTLPSRELAGEPDGSADSNDVNELAISSAVMTAQPVSSFRSPPSTPPPPPPQASPPVNDVVQPPPPRSSFLHSLQSTRINSQQVTNLRIPVADKPKLPSKPTVLPESGNVQADKVQMVNDEDVAAIADDTENTLTNQQIVPKRQAPKPPASVALAEQPATPDVSSVAPHRSPTAETANGNLFMRKASVNSNDFDTSVSKSRDKRIYQTPSNCNSNVVADFARSMSHDSSFGALLTNASATATVTKRGSKVRSTLRKLLRFGSRDDDMFDDSSSGVVLTTHGNNNSNSGVSTPRVRPEIIHPLDLNKSGVQVLRNVTDHEQIYSNCIAKMDEDLGSTQMNTNKQRPASHYGALVGGVQSHYATSNTGRPNKPPPPPRCQSLDLTSTPVRGPAPPARPPPPTSTFAKTLLSQTTAATLNNNLTADNFVYVNLGDAGKPVKPTRSAPGREVTVCINQLSTESNYNDDGNVYEPVMVSRPKSVISDSNSVYGQYNRIGSTENLLHNNINSKVIDQSELKEQKVMLNDQLKKNCTVIHNSMEDNYKALVSSNHEALSRFLQQENGKFFTGTRCSLVKSSEPLVWTDFKLDDSVQSIEIGNRVFYAAHYKGQLHEAVTLCVTPKCQVTVGKAPNQLQMLAEFVDFIPKQFLHTSNTTDNHSSNVVQVNVAVMIRQTVESFNRHIWPTQDSVVVRSVSTFGDSPENSANKSLQTKESILALFQLIDCLLLLHQHGVNNIYQSDLVLCKYHNGVYSNGVKSTNSDESSLHVCLLPHVQLNKSSKYSTNENGYIDCKGGSGSTDQIADKDDCITLIQCITDALQSIPVPPHMSAHLQRLLKNHPEKTDLLFRMKVVVGLWLWGPPNDVTACSSADKQKVIQHWLDLERAKVLHNLLMSYHSPQLLNVYDWSYASFLVRIDAKTIIDILNSIGDYRLFTSGSFGLK